MNIMTRNRGLWSSKRGPSGPFGPSPTRTEISHSAKTLTLGEKVSKVSKVHGKVESPRRSATGDISPKAQHRPVINRHEENGHAA
jgi:hypothetical protein